MSIFRNRTRNDLWLATPDGGIKKVDPEEEFEACNFFKRYTIEHLDADQVLLDIVQDDHRPWSKTNVPNRVRSWTNMVPPCSRWCEHRINMEHPDFLGQPARFLQIIVDYASVLVRINFDDDSVFLIDEGTSQTFNTDELLVSMIEFRNPSNSGDVVAMVRTIAAANYKTC